MEEIKDVVSRIVAGCDHGNVTVSEILAAFVARTIVESNMGEVFALDKPLTAAAKDDVVVQSIERLLTKDSPQLETMKMQVDFDSSFWNEDNEFQKILRLRTKILASHRMGIVELEMANANDFETLTLLYRKIFQFLLEFSPGTKQLADKTVEREIAAALESVFPRIGLKAFIQLRADDKSTQLMELARIVFGIRLFNRSQGRGGADIENLDDVCDKLRHEFEVTLEEQIVRFTAICAEQQKTVVRAHLIKRRQDSAAGESKEDTKGHGPNSRYTAFVVSNQLLDRWSQELANRRQYLSFLKQLQAENSAIQSRLSELREAVRNDLSSLLNMITGKSSVPKEQVYPRFELLATNWLLFWESFNILKARIKTYQVLSRFQSSYTATLSNTVLSDEPTDAASADLLAGAAGLLIQDRPTATLEHSLVDKDDTEYRTVTRAGDPTTTRDVSSPRTAEAKARVASSAISPTDESYAAPEGEAKGAKDSAAESKEGGTETDDAAGAKTRKASHELSVVRDEVEIEDKAESGAVLLSVSETPDFMSLPLELQGFCPWSMVTGRGLLIPGRPTLGIIRYENLYYIFDNLVAIRAFMDEPERYLQGIRDLALKSPEFIHILRLQASMFPTVAISKLLEGQSGDAGGLDPLMDANGKPMKRDAATGTPTHFVEGHVDKNYHWNEWELRRRALKLVNLKNCSTQGQQTDQSHFRRDNDSQVYISRESGTQTKRDKGTNPPIKTTYIAGLRGVAPVNSDGTLAVSRYIEEKDSGGGTVAPNADILAAAKKMKAKVVTLTLDL
jgi:hypothetical protein